MSTATAVGSADRAGEIVRFTRRSARRYNRARTSLPDLFVDVYVSVLALGCAVALAVSFVLALRGEFAQRSTTDSGLIADPVLVLPSQALEVLLTFAALTAVVVLGRRLGPLAVGGPESTWWLSLPVDRRPMVWGPFLRRTVLAGVGAAVAYTPVSILSALERTPPTHAFAAATFGLAVAATLGVAALLQQRPGAVGLKVTAAVLVVGGALAVVLVPSVWTASAGLVLAVALLAFVSPRAGFIPGAELTRAGAVSGHVGSSLYFMDSNELLRAVRAESRTAHRRGARFFARRTSRPFTALLRADVVAFLRLHPTPTTAVLWLMACVAVMLVDGGLPVFVQLGAVVIAGCAVASGFGAVARKAALVPELDGLVPVGPALVRASRSFMPAVAMALWMMVLCGVLVLLGAAGPMLILLAALSGVGMGAGSVRGATRPATDWSAPPVETPFGPVPRAQLASLLRGVDVTVLSLMPVALTLYLGVVALPVLVVQGVISAVVFLVVAMTNPHGNS
ncbi:DUF6297 family protein [uncultured Arthrobacter sp.]|uniref:DUF6297 family protein n=1 Tax=uncultured Arthrobacter sp. TaxID=114050 RepID=UPI002620A807|nr:DUF6297 family protein [uncultured Arthrobacter sp.]